MSHLRDPFEAADAANTFFEDVLRDVFGVDVHDDQRVESHSVDHVASGHFDQLNQLLQFVFLVSVGDFQGSLRSLVDCLFNRLCPLDLVDHQDDLLRPVENPILFGHLVVGLQTLRNTVCQAISHLVLNLEKPLFNRANFFQLRCLVDTR